MPECLLFFCFMIAPTPGVVPDGMGGYVPITNSRVLPDGELRPYDPLLDGPFIGEPIGVFIEPPEGPDGVYGR
jgi:hypothetical protein